MYSRIKNNEKKITVITTFANEGQEVENTLKSLFEYSDKKDIEVIIINDASDDNFNYKEVASKYNVTYIENKQRLGVAASRDKGINQCKTEYFLLLDAHMRFYNDKWKNRIIEELDKDPKTLLCTQTKVLRKTENGEVIEDNRPFDVLGAYINYYVLFRFLEPEWSYRRQPEGNDKEEATLLIPCVLGAGYACSKKYWQYLRGLEGLFTYGNDEVLISLKVWLNGGTCKLLKDVQIGHIYRYSSPYEHNTTTRLYNRLYISYLMLPAVLRKKAFAIQKLKDAEIYFKSSWMFYENFEYIDKMKAELSKKLTGDFYEHEKLNRSRDPKKKSLKKRKQQLLKHIAYIIRNIDKAEGIGLKNGKTAIVILLYHYARSIDNEIIFRIADNLLDEIIGGISEEIPLNLVNGLTGIGWAIEYLAYNRFICGDTNDILADIDVKVTTLNVSRITDYNLEYGLGGIVRYLLARLFSNKMNNTQCLFSKEFLEEVYIKTKDILEKKEYNNCPETFMEYVWYYENKKDIDPPCMYEVALLPEWSKFGISKKKLSLEGLVGSDLEFILTTDLFGL